MPRGMPTPKATSKGQRAQVQRHRPGAADEPHYRLVRVGEGAPKSPRTTPLSQMRYRCHKGLSSP